MDAHNAAKKLAGIFMLKVVKKISSPPMFVMFNEDALAASTTVLISSIASNSY